MTVTLERINSRGRTTGSADLSADWDGGSIVLKLGRVRVRMTLGTWLRFVRGVAPAMEYTHCRSCDGHACPDVR